MKIQRKENAVRNIKIGFIAKFIELLFPFVCRTIIIKYLGSDYAGLNGLFTSILSILNLTELGFGTALIFNMYKAVAENDDAMMCALMNVYKTVYQIIGCVVFILGILLIPFLGGLVKGEYPSDISLTAVYLINLISTVSTYFLYAYKKSVLIAYQRNDIIFKIDCFQNIIQGILQCGLLILFRNYYIYLIVMPLGVFANNIISAVSVKKLYPQFQPHGKLPADMWRKIKRNLSGVCLYKIGNAVSNAADNIIISAHMGLAMVTVYGNYYCIITVLFAFLGMYYSSISPGLGNCIAIEKPEDNLKLFYRLFFVQGWMIGWMSICMICLYQDFIELWVGSSMLLPYGAVLLLVLCFYLWKLNDIVYLYEEAAGLWEYAKLRPVISASTNLMFNIFLIKRIGIYGVIISTIVCDQFLGLTWEVILLFKKYFKYGLFTYYKKFIKYTCVNCFIGLITLYFCSFIKIPNSYAALFAKAAACVIIPNILFLAAYFRCPEFLECKEDVINFCRKRG